MTMKRTPMPPNRPDRPWPGRTILAFSSAMSQILGFVAPGAYPWSDRLPAMAGKNAGLIKDLRMPKDFS